MLTQYVVLSRFSVDGMKMTTLIMILQDKQKAEMLRNFLSRYKYFDTPITVEEYKGYWTPEVIKQRIAYGF